MTEATEDQRSEVADLTERVVNAEDAVLRSVEITTRARYSLQGVHVGGPEFQGRMSALHSATQNEYRAADEWVSAKAALTAQLKQQED